VPNFKTISKVALIYCDSYEPEAVKEAVSKGISLLGGFELFIKQNEKILLKPNLLTAEIPEQAVTTHPAVFRAVAELLLEYGANVSYGDSPALMSPLEASKGSGIAEVAEELGISLADFENGKEINLSAGQLQVRVPVANAIFENQGVVSIPKLKTHGLEKLTLCIKNQYGCVPGLIKGEFHVRYPDPIDFARLLVEINQYVNPRLYIVDGILAMEGPGPRSGIPKKMNILLLSSDPVALDSVVCKMLGVNPEFLPTVKIASDCGYGVSGEDEIEIVGDPFHRFVCNDFKVSRKRMRKLWFAPLLRRLGTWFLKSPCVDKDKCIHCGQCVKICPVSPAAISIKARRIAPLYHYGRCIRCYCCQEICPVSAIYLKESLMRRVASRLIRRWRG
jgi:uncharacterized protein (DUF362 family)/Pyruvate/2-oxoacid:ferredoxin oxidoreductase delta subunit